MKVITETRRTDEVNRNTSYQMKVQKHVVPWRLLQKHVPDEGLYQMKVITETRRTRWRLLQKHVYQWITRLPDDGYYRNTSSDEGYYRNTSYQMKVPDKVITETRRQMKVIQKHRTRWRLLQK